MLGTTGPRTTRTAGAAAAWAPKLAMTKIATPRATCARTRFIWFEALARGVVLAPLVTEEAPVRRRSSESESACCRRRGMRSASRARQESTSFPLVLKVTELLDAHRIRLERCPIVGRDHGFPRGCAPREEVRRGSVTWRSGPCGQQGRDPWMHHRSPGEVPRPIASTIPIEFGNTPVARERVQRQVRYL